VYPVTQLPCEQTRYPSWSAEAFKEMSGTSRCPSAGIPDTPVCQLGLAKNVLVPPPLAEMPPPCKSSMAVSFQVVSGMYAIAAPLVLFQ
jgi:hypothetical protein